MSFSQKVFDYSLRQRGLAHRVARKALHASRSATRADTLVTYDLEGIPLLVPATHEAPHTWTVNPDYSKSLGRVAKAMAAKYPGSVFVDIGANVGDSAAIIRASGVSNLVISIEGLERFYRILEKNARTIGNVKPVQCFVGTHEGAASVKMQVFDTGNAILWENDAPDRSSLQTVNIEMRTLTNILDEHAPNAEVKLFKTDIECNDMPVISANAELLRKNHPAIFLELHVSDDDEKRFGLGWKDFFAALRDAGYDKALYWRNSEELMSVVRLDDEEAMLVTNEYFRNRRGLVYADVCVLHRDDADVAERLVAGEIALARSRPDESSGLPIA